MIYLKLTHEEEEIRLYVPLSIKMCERANNENESQTEEIVIQF